MVSVPSDGSTGSGTQRQKLNQLLFNRVSVPSDGSTGSGTQAGAYRLPQSVLVSVPSDGSTGSGTTQKLEEDTQRRMFQYPQTGLQVVELQRGGQRWPFTFVSVPSDGSTGSGTRRGNSPRVGRLGFQYPQTGLQVVEHLESAAPWPNAKAFQYPQTGLQVVEPITHSEGMGLGAVVSVPSDGSTGSGTLASFDWPEAYTRFSTLRRVYR